VRNGVVNINNIFNAGGFLPYLPLKLPLEEGEF
jgi:hypothetical protein